MQTGPQLYENIPLKEFCTFNIGGPARYFFKAYTIEAMQRALFWCRSNEIPYLILGKGSNCLFDDEGYSGAIILNKIEFFNIPYLGTFHVGAGYSFSLLSVQTARKGWGGLEFASGIPASVGGAIYMNAGANGSETCQTLSSVDFIDEKGDLSTIPRSDLMFSYRHSPFQNLKGAIVGATFTLKPKSEARKQQIELINIRKQTQPYGTRSAGCVFLNPASGNAGQLIEQCGLKGFMIGRAQVSPVHANFLINVDTATGKEMQTLITFVQARVKEVTGIELRSEIRRIPYQAENL